jgi:hypothetical protein
MKKRFGGFMHNVAETHIANYFTRVLGNMFDTD